MAEQEEDDQNLMENEQEKEIPESFSTQRLNTSSNSSHEPIQTLGASLSFDMEVSSSGRTYSLYGRKNVVGTDQRLLIFAGLCHGDVQLAALDTFVWLPGRESFQILFFALEEHNQLLAVLLTEAGGECSLIGILCLRFCS